MLNSHISHSSLSLFVITLPFSLSPVLRIIHRLFLVPSCTAAFLVLWKLSLQERNTVTIGLLDERWTAWLSNVPRGTGSWGQPLHSALVGTQKPGSIYQTAGRSHHTISFPSADDVWDMFREIFFFFPVLMLTEAGARKESHDFRQSLQMTWKTGRVSLTEPACHTRSAPMADRKGWWGEGVVRPHTAPPRGHLIYLYQLQLDASHSYRFSDAPHFFTGHCFQACWKGREIRWGNKKNKC